VARRGQVRFGWRKLSKPYRARLERQGISQTYWENGGDLRRARGHTKDLLSANKSPLDQRVIDRLVLPPSLGGGAKPEDFAAVRKVTFAWWIPTNMRADVKAALSQLQPPNKWKSVVLCPRSDHDAWRMTVTYNNRYEDTVEIDIPGGGEELSGAKQVLDLLYSPPSTGQRGEAWANWGTDQLRIDPTCST
jgi:hypothetical protein